MQSLAKMHILTKMTKYDIKVLLKGVFWLIDHKIKLIFAHDNLFMEALNFSIYHSQKRKLQFKFM